MLWTLDEFRAYFCVNLKLSGSTLRALDWVISRRYIKWLFTRITKEFDQAKQLFSVAHIESWDKCLGINPRDSIAEKYHYHFYIIFERKSPMRPVSRIFFYRLPWSFPGVGSFVQNFALETPLKCYRELTQSERFDNGDHGVLPARLYTDEFFLFSLVNRLLSDGVTNS